MNFKESYRLERKYYENIYTLLNVLRELKSNATATEIQKVEELLDNAIADNESIILIYKNLGELYSEVSLRYGELSKLLNELKENLEDWKDEINNKIDDVNNTLMIYIRELQAEIDQIESGNKSWSIPAEELEYYQEEYKFNSCQAIQNYNGRRGTALFTFDPSDYQNGILYSIGLYHDSYMNNLFTSMPRGSAVTFFIRWEPYYQTNGYNTIGFREMISITKDANGLLSFAPVYSSMGEMEMWGKRGFIRLLPSEETLKITYQFDIIWSGTITESVIDDVIKNSIVLNIQN